MKMKSLEGYIDEFKDRLNLTSDYQLAEELGVSRQQISKIRNGQAAIGRDKCIRIAKALKIEPIEIIACVEAGKEKRVDVRSVWIKLFKEKSHHGTNTGY